MIMKKYIYLLLVGFVAFLTSCSNDDITISKTVNFTVNPSTVVEPYVTKYSYILTDVLGSNKGELESFSTNYKLRIRLFVYNKDGELIKTVSGEYSNYDVKLKESVFLPVGTYTAIAISDIYSPSDGFEYWAVSGESQLATLKIADTGYFGDARTILGTTKQTFSIKDASIDVNIDIKSAGALFLVLYSNIFRYSDVTEYELSVNKLQSSIDFGSNGDYTISTQNNNGKYDWRISSVKLEDIDKTQYSGARRWATQLPMNNVGVCFSYWASNSKESKQFGSGKNLDIRAGDGYFCWLNLASTGTTVDYATAEEAEKWFKGNLTRYQDRGLSRQLAPLPNLTKPEKRNDTTVGQYIYPKNL